MPAAPNLCDLWHTFSPTTEHPMPVLSYPGKNLAVTYVTEVCVHAGECVRGLPTVFDVDRDPWIQPDGAPADQVISQIGACPSGALEYSSTDG